MKKRGKKYQDAIKKIDTQKRYQLLDALKLLKEINYAKYDATVLIAVNLGVDPKRSDQMVRGGVPLPAGLGKQVRVLVFAKGEKISEATSAGADHVGGEEIIEKIQKENWLEFDKVIATPDMMGKVGKVARILGPRGLMPNPKIGTVTFDLEPAIKELKMGKAIYKVEKAGICHIAAGKISFEPEQLVENIEAILSAIIRAKPATSKGTYLKNVTLSSSLSPGIRLDLNEFKG